MKKIYQKPIILIENMALNMAIANGCEFSNAQQGGGYTENGIDLSWAFDLGFGLLFFEDVSGSACEKFGECYHNSGYTFKGAYEDIINAGGAELVHSAS